MINQVAQAQVILNTVGLIFLWFLVFKLYRGYRLDRFRMEMFVVRDRLFDRAADGLIDFSHPAYKLVRQTMNGFIRNAHSMSLMQVLLFGLFMQPVSDADRFESRFKAACAGLDQSVVAELDLFVAQMNDLVIDHVILFSPEFMITLVIPALATLLLSGVSAMTVRALKVVRGWFKEPVGRLDRAAMIYGK